MQSNELGRHEPPREAGDEFVRQISDALRRARGKRSLARLEQETGITRQKLARIERGQVHELPVRELLALNSLLGGRLLEILHDLRGTKMADLLAEASGITFILGARELEWADHVSRWDVRAMTAVLRAVQRRSGNLLEFDVEDALHPVPHELRPGVAVEDYLASMRQERWFGSLDQIEDRAIIACGSPRACHASEYMLSSMFGEKPFSRWRAGSPPRPFGFLWTTALLRGLPSAFARATVRDDGNEPRSGILGLQIQDKEYAIDDRSHSWSTYGVGVAQRRSGGQLWMVVAGATGTATYAVASMLAEVRGILPKPKSSSEHSPPVWFAVEAEVQREGDRGGDNRVVKRTRLISEPMIWDRETRSSRPPPKARHSP